ncbi:MAG: hypothetical protein LBF64_02295 [Oscillospiraceae bacterium]|jgi:hypothetical protein|nr:hypothetical protein [Oscillospiraceae bacterium]
MKRRWRRPDVRAVLFLCLWAAGLSVCLVLTGLNVGAATAEQMLLSLLGGLYMDGFPSLLLVVTYNLIILSQLFLFGALMPRTVDTAAVVLFTRSYGRIRWFFTQSGAVLARSLVFSLLLAAGLTLGAAAVGAPVQNWGTFAALLLTLVPTAWLGNAAFLLLANVIGLRCGPARALLLVWILYMPGQILAGLSQGADLWIKLYPAAQTVLPLHEVPPALTEVIDSFFSRAVSGFTPLFSLVYNTALIALTLIVGRALMRKQDFSL